MKRPLLMLISVAATIAMAAPAYADDPPAESDADFVKQLTNAGFTFKDPTQAVAVAKNVCDMANKGTPATDIKQKLEQGNSFSGNGAVKFITLAATAYCPKQLPEEEGQPSKSPGTEGN